MGGKHPLLSMELAKIEDPNEGLEDLRVKKIPADLNLDVMIPDVPNLMERRDKNVSLFYKNYNIVSLHSFKVVLGSICNYDC